MNLDNISAAASAASQAQTGAAVQISVLKKAIDIEGAGALALVQGAVAAMPSNPAHLGQNIDVYV
jgi:hypothetical protein